jgi:hypothetical protein
LLAENFGSDIFVVPTTKGIFMKLKFTLLAAAAILSGQCFAFDANLVGVEYYKGDKGKSNICDVGDVLVSEVYRIDLPSEADLVYKSQESGKTAKEQTIKYQRENGNVTLDVCNKAGAKIAKQVWFVNRNGDLSNQNLRVIIDTTQTHLILDANKWPLEIPIK